MLKRKSSEALDGSDHNSKRRKLDNANTLEVGLMSDLKDSFIDYSKYQAQLVHSINVSGCVHKICYPPTADDADTHFANHFTQSFDELDTDSVIKFPYILDVFQKQSICGIENHDNVLVAAHTSAGKTTVALYAIAKALHLNERVIYTSPIKALSNQKYRELSEKFGHDNVGLLTGDTSINRDAGCIVMTTEILRNMLYRGAEIIREISWVIFDEIHYMKDPHRGVVWEETLILLPKQSRFVFLSATIPNSSEFAKWIAKINTFPCHVIYTEYRPVPLQHYIFPRGGNGIYLCVDHKSNFKEANFQRALNGIKSDDETRKSKQSAKSANNEKDKDIFKLIRMIMEREFDPCIVFAFSKKEVENLALSLSKLDFTSMEEKKLICRIFNNGIATLNDDDKLLPQIQSLVHLLQRGIGIHHSGLLPILKEIVEILFGEGLIRILFTTETFAMGVNFPAKSVIFSDVNKWDGMTHRLLTSSEYIQMSGRAGRRGLDERGIVIMMMKNNKLQPQQIQTMLKGKSNYLASQFHTTYPMLIQLKRLQEIEPTFIINRSFMQFQKLEKIPSLMQKLKELQERMAQIPAMEHEVEVAVEKYLVYQKSLNDLYVSMVSIVNKPKHVLSWLNPGRLLFIAQPAINKSIGWCICINYKKISKKDLKILQTVHKNKNLNIEYIVDVLSSTNQIMSVQLHHIQKFSAIRLNMQKFQNLAHSENKAKLGLVLNECLKRNGDDLKELHPKKHLNINEPKLDEIYQKIDILNEKIKAFVNEHSMQNVEQLCMQYKSKKDMELEVVSIQNEMSALESNQHIEQKLSGMNRVLRRLKMVDTASNVITIKGKVACEISCGDELILTELLFSNFFTDLSSDYINALLSCFVFDEVTSTGNEGSKFSDEMNEKLYKKLREKIVQICEIQIEAKLEMNSKKYVDSFSAGLMDIVLSWSRGAKFSQISKMTTIYEGSIIRVLKRLSELLCELVACSTLMGNEKLTQKLEHCKEIIKRDIVFSASLYL